MSRLSYVLAGLSLVCFSTGCCIFPRCGCSPCGNACGAGGGYGPAYYGGGYPMYGGQPVSYAEPYGISAENPGPAEFGVTMGEPVPMVAESYPAPVAPQGIAPIPQPYPPAPYVSQGEVPATAYYKMESLPTYE